MANPKKTFRQQCEEMNGKKIVSKTKNIVEELREGAAIAVEEGDISSSALQRIEQTATLIDD